MSHQLPSSHWLIGSTHAARAVLRADMIVEGEITPPNAVKPWLLPIPPTGQVFTSGFADYLSARKQPLKARNDLPPSGQALYDIVAAELSANPVDAEGRQWANLSARHLADELGRSVRQVQRLYSGDPFRHVVKRIGGKNTTLIRIGHPADLSPEDQARMMVKFWRRATGRKETPEEFGCLVGIAKDCPTGLGFDVFRTIVRNWSPFMACAKVAQYLAMHDGGDEFDPDPEKFYARYYAFPSIKVIRRFLYVASDFYDDRVQNLASEPKCPDVCSHILKVLKGIGIQSSSKSVGTKKET
ncbi:hypothetical protein GLS40_08020 [Pseudooceanicola sp. 216_PA32_1]|uniref:Uncharacterized protein n=1 Tax=Pseudooceanicola pacificus TaxID=2676438 RepID=A0A844W4H3_9RHOB|nr:hypothetical protein [Pseudooceanicola pacificus]MWB77965.1 hypothetical protein [Pseudooceanicola pacificus]